MRRLQSCLDTQITCNDACNFWVALGSMSPRSQTFLDRQPWLPFSCDARSWLSSKCILHATMTGFKLQRVVLRYSLDGQSKKDLEEQTGKVALVSESREHEGKLYLGSAFLPQLAIYTIT